MLTYNWIQQFEAAVNFADIDLAFVKQKHILQYVIAILV